MREEVISKINERVKSKNLKHWKDSKNIDALE